MSHISLRYILTRDSACKVNQQSHFLPWRQDLRSSSTARLRHPASVLTEEGTGLVPCQTPSKTVLSAAQREWILYARWKESPVQHKIRREITWTWVSEELLYLFKQTWERKSAKPRPIPVKSFAFRPVFNPDTRDGQLEECRVTKFTRKLRK